MTMEEELLFFQPKMRIADRRGGLDYISPRFLTSSFERDTSDYLCLYQPAFELFACTLTSKDGLGVLRMGPRGSPSLFPLANFFVCALTPLLCPSCLYEYTAVLLEKVTKWMTCLVLADTWSFRGIGTRDLLFSVFPGCLDGIIEEGQSRRTKGTCGEC